MHQLYHLKLLITARLILFQIYLFDTRYRMAGFLLYVGVSLSKSSYDRLIFRTIYCHL
jgi:hypothetical protein